MQSRVAVIYYGGFSRFGGVFSHVTALGNGLTAMGWTVVIVTLDRLPIWCRYVPHLVEVIINVFNRPLGYYYKGNVTRWLYQLFFDGPADLRIFEDIYISWNSTFPSVTILHAVWSDNLHSCPVNMQQERKLKVLEAQAIENIDHPIATVSVPYWKYIVDVHFERHLAKIIDVVELGISQSGCEIGGCRRRIGKSIIFVGALEARKNVLFLLRVYAKLVAVDPDFKLTIVGDGPERDTLVRFVEDQGVNVTFLGALNHSEVLFELRQHQIYLHTSVKESFSYSLLEARLMGLMTCAYAELQVPSEFIDIKIAKFEVDEWCNGIWNIDWEVEGTFVAENYTVEKMTAATLRLTE